MYRMARKSVTIVAVLSALVPQSGFAQRAGTLIAAQPVIGTPEDMRAWRVQYWTSDNGKPIRVTGMVIAPRGRSNGGPRRVIAWTHGLIGIAQRCAPSIGMGNFTVIPALGDAIRRGYTIVAPDYPGLGSDMIHPVLVGRSEGSSVLDAVRAARAIPEAEAGSRFALWGESQGGHAALWAGQMAARYAPDLQLVGIAAIVPPTDLARNLSEGKDLRVRALLTSYTAASWSRYYNAPMSTFGSRQTQNVMLRLADNNCVVAGAKPRLGTILGIAVVQGVVRKIDLSRQHPWARLMRKNNPSAAAIAVPAMIYTGTDDSIVAPAVVHDFARRACALNKTISYKSIPGGEHATVARTEGKATLQWIDDRFARKRAPNNCRSI
ncbi:alpha/beta fold hydrolase [Sphingomonas sp. Leaf339]|uniref:alpha/beta fold hydrolase n=1 Tax=Sphingomonas sp. Leaf339 TaxID=1736343 RepID=UPI0009EC1584|nr:alpha/beta fold hydrolase [Sphingomonas sp. Leaf339]